MALELSYVLTQLFNGLVWGSLYVLVAIGLTLIFGMLGIVNFAHGSLMLVGAYLAWAVTTSTGSFFLGILAAPLGVLVIGALFERLALRRIYDYDVVLQLLLTFGFAELLHGAIVIIWGRQGKNFSIPAWGQHTIDLVAFDYPGYRLFVILLTFLIVLGLYVWLTRTDYGMIVRAATDDREMTYSLGVNIYWLFLVVFAIGSAVVGIAGGLTAPLFGTYPDLGVEFLIPSFVVVVVGGLTSFRGTIIAAFIIGELNVWTGVLYPRLQGIVIFLFMVIVLLVKPGGLFGSTQEAH